MPRGGHNRKTAAQAKMDGTYRGDRHADPIDIAPGDVEPPTEMSESARKMWDRYIAPRCGLGFYEPAEAPMLAMWCSMYVRFVQADGMVPIGGVFESEDENGFPVFERHPAVGISLKFAAEFRALSARLGLDPLARLALAKPGDAGSGTSPAMPAGAPPAWKPKLVEGGKSKPKVPAKKKPPAAKSRAKTPKGKK